MAPVPRAFRPPRIPLPDRIRKILGSFGWIEHRFVREGHIRTFTPEDVILYVFFILVANRDGVSFYRKDKICDAIGLSWDQFHTACRHLLERGYVAFEPFGPHAVDGYYQVLPLPEPVRV